MIKFRTHALTAAAAVFLFARAAGGQSPTPSPAPVVTPAPNTPEGKQLIESREVLLAAYAPCLQKYNEAHGALLAAGGASAAGLNTLEDIAARKALIDACSAANDSMITFLTTEPDILRQELGKVSMEPAKIDEYLKNFSPDPTTPQLLKIRTLAGQMFKEMSQSMTVLSDSYGRWKLGKGGMIVFKKQGDNKQFAAVVKRIQHAVAEQTAAQALLKASDPKSAGLDAAPAPAPESSGLTAPSPKPKPTPEPAD